MLWTCRKAYSEVNCVQIRVQESKFSPPRKHATSIIIQAVIQKIYCRGWWPWTKPGYIITTQRQSNNQCSGGIAAHTAPQKISGARIRWKSSRLDFLGSRRHPPHWLSSKGPNCQRGVLFISAGAIERHFEGKSRGKVSKGVLFLHDNATAHRALANPEETGLPGLPMSSSWPTLFSGSGPVRLPPVHWTEKTIEKSLFFVRLGGHCCRGDLVWRTTFWFFSECPAKVRTTD